MTADSSAEKQRLQGLAEEARKAAGSLKEKATETRGVDHKIASLIGGSSTGADQVAIGHLRTARENLDKAAGHLMAAASVAEDWSSRA